MPNRILREGILTSERVAALNWQEEVFYRRLMSVVDDFGRYHANPKLLRAACYPLLIDKVSDADIGKWLTSCVTAALVSVYPAPDGKRYLQLLDFRQQARADKSKYPQMSSECVAPAVHPIADAHLDGGGDGVVKDSVANATAALPPREQTKAELWEAGKSLLVEAGVPAAQCGSFVGKLVKDYGEAVVVDAVRSAVKATPADPKEYLKATCQRLKGEKADVVTVPSIAPAKTNDYLAELAAHAAAVEAERQRRKQAA